MIILSTFLSTVAGKLGFSKLKKDDTKIYYSQEYSVFYQTRDSSVSAFIRVTFLNKPLQNDKEIIEEALCTFSDFNVVNKESFIAQTRVIPGEIILNK